MGRPLTTRLGGRHHMRVVGDQTTGRAMLAAGVLSLAALVSLPAPTSTRPEHVVVMAARGALATAEAAVRAAGGRVGRQLSVIDGFTAVVPARSLPSLSRTSGVRSVTPNRRLSLQAQYGQESGVASAVYSDVVRASKTWGAGDIGSGVTVAVVDTGINTDGDLAGQVVKAVDFTSDGDTADRYGHGTFVA